MKVYFDNASTTPLLEEVKEKMIQTINDEFGNPSSIHCYGRQAKSLIEEARKTVANCLNASTGEIFFTSGATEANNMSLLCSIRDLGIRRIISSPTEHHCILHTLDYIKAHNLASVTLLDTDAEGKIDNAQLKELLAKEDTPTLVSLMHANNEIGTMIDLNEVADICKEHNALFHCDTAQTIGKYPIDLNLTKIAFLAGSAHKFFGPKGAGFIYINNNNIIKPMVHGGDQERGIRSGTENIYGITGLAKALELAHDNMKNRHQYVLELKAYFRYGLEKQVPGVQFNGSKEDQLYNILSVSFPPSGKTEMLMMNLDIAGICASGGSACSSGVENDSHVLQAIGHDPSRKTIRFSLSHFNTKNEIDYVLEKIGPMVS